MFSTLDLDSNVRVLDDSLESLAHWSKKLGPYTQEKQQDGPVIQVMPMAAHQSAISHHHQATSAPPRFSWSHSCRLVNLVCQSYPRHSRPIFGWATAFLSIFRSMVNETRRCNMSFVHPLVGLSKYSILKYGKLIVFLLCCL